MVRIRVLLLLWGSGGLGWSGRAGRERGSKGTGGSAVRKVAGKGCENVCRKGWDEQRGKAKGNSNIALHTPLSKNVP